WQFAQVAHRNSCDGRCGNCLKSSVASCFPTSASASSLSAYILGGATCFVLLREGALDQQGFSVLSPIVDLLSDLDLDPFVYRTNSCRSAEAPERGLPARSGGNRPRQRLADIRQRTTRCSPSMAAICGRMTGRFQRQPGPLGPAHGGGWCTPTPGTAGSDRITPPPRILTKTFWTWPGALLYTISVVTNTSLTKLKPQLLDSQATRHVVPKTNYGRIATILYSIIGIPLMLLCLANFGSFMASVLRLIYRLTCRPCLLLLAALSQNAVEKKRGGRRCGCVTRRRSGARRSRASLWCSRRTPRPATAVVDAVAPTAVPLWLPMAILIGYIAMGAVFFAAWEQWDLLSASYFVFITPQAHHRLVQRDQAVICCLYLLFGLALIAMCFELMQAGVKAKVKRLAKRSVVA
uniref:Ion_trans_2 domain-containing protein n=1 Tax=Macrostomum lignano TaxID=282301 RepID=A0A1I8FGV9_9PLAT